MSDYGSWAEFGPLLNDNKVFIVISTANYEQVQKKGVIYFKLVSVSLQFIERFVRLYFCAVTCDEVSVKQSVLLQIKKMDFRFAVITMMDLGENMLVFGWLFSGKIG
jgi:hypothetical protein